MCRFAVRTRLAWLEAFLGGTASMPTAGACARALHSPLSIRAAPDLPGATAYRVGGAHRPRHLAPRVPPSLCRACARRGRTWHGNLDPSSIAYGIRPRLRPASPAADQHGCGTLGHTVGGIRTPLALLMPTFALPAAPPPLPRWLHRRRGRSPTMASRSSPSAASVTGLSPGGLSVPPHIRAEARFDQ
jgi:hypothetical protein